jgi:hypothetical protein
MKRLITSVFVLFALVSFSAPAENNNDARKTNTEIAPASATVMMEQLQQENALLKAQLATLSVYYETLESAAAYRLMMTNMFARIEADNSRQQYEELRAQLAYSQMMGTMFINLKQTAKK